MISIQSEKLLNPISFFQFAKEYKFKLYTRLYKLSTTSIPVDGVKMWKLEKYKIEANNYLVHFRSMIMRKKLHIPLLKDSTGFNFKEAYNFYVDDKCDEYDTYVFYKHIENYLDNYSHRKNITLVENFNTGFNYGKKIIIDSRDILVNTDIFKHYRSKNLPKGLYVSTKEKIIYELMFVKTTNKNFKFKDIDFCRNYFI